MLQIKNPREQLTDLFYFLSKLHLHNDAQLILVSTDTSQKIEVDFEQLERPHERLIRFIEYPIKLTQFTSKGEEFETVVFKTIEADKFFVQNPIIPINKSIQEYENYSFVEELAKANDINMGIFSLDEGKATRLSLSDSVVKGKKFIFSTQPKVDSKKIKESRTAKATKLANMYADYILLEKNRASAILERRNKIAFKLHHLVGMTEYILRNNLHVGKQLGLSCIYTKPSNEDMFYIYGYTFALKVYTNGAIEELFNFAKGDTIKTAYEKSPDLFKHLVKFSNLRGH